YFDGLGGMRHRAPGTQDVRRWIFLHSVIRANYVTLGIVLLVAAGQMLPRRMHAQNFLVSWLHSLSSILGIGVTHSPSSPPSRPSASPIDFIQPCRDNLLIHRSNGL